MALFNKEYWMAKNGVKVDRAVEKVKRETDQYILEEIAKRAPNYRVRSAAIAKVKNQDFLIDLVRNDKEHLIRLNTISLLDSQDVLEDIVKNNEDSLARVFALKRIHNQDLIIQVAQNDENWQVRETAVEKLEDQKIIQSIAVNDQDKTVRYKAVQYITDNEILMNIIENESEYIVKTTAVRAISDQSLLEELVVKSVDCDVKLTAAIRLEGKDKICQNAYEFIVKNGSDYQTRKTALSRLHNKEAFMRRPEIAEDILRNDEYPPFMMKVIDYTNNEELLRELYEKTSDFSLKFAVGDRLKEIAISKLNS